MDKHKAIPQGYMTVGEIASSYFVSQTFRLLFGRHKEPSYSTRYAEIADVLMEQDAVLRQKIESLSESLRELELLREEVLQMQSVDFKKYADIIFNLQMKNDFYLLIKHFDDQTLDHVRSHFIKTAEWRL